MRSIRPLLAAVAGLALIAPGAARASSSIIVDAGTTQRVEVATPLFLEARTDEDPAPLSFAWTAPVGCIIDDPGARISTASCADTGLRPFTVAATGPSGSGSDTVTMVIVRSFSETHRFTGSAVAGAPDEFTGSGDVDGATTRYPFEVPMASDIVDATLDWTLPSNDIELVLEDPNGDVWAFPDGRTLTVRPRRVTVHEPVPGTWTAQVRPRASVAASWELTVDISGATGDADIPAITVRPPRGEPGEPVTLTASVAGGTAPLTIAWETSSTSVAFDDGTGSSITFPFVDDVAVKAKVSDAAGLEQVQTVFVRRKGSVPDNLPFTVVAVIDFGFSPYHYDFAWHQHPWNLDADPYNDFDFQADPATYIEGFPGATPIQLTIPESPDEDVSGYRTGVDADAWAGFEPSSDMLSPDLYWFPGTKIIGAVRDGSDFYGSNSSHGTRSAASAAGNIHGTCPECVFVLLQGAAAGQLEWVASQPWIDAVNNSYGHCLSLCAVRDGVYFNSPTQATRAGTERGMSIMFSAGNGLANAFDVPQLTYTSSEQGPDWIVTVGANSPTTDQNYLGSGKPADISSYGSSYPSSGGATANGTGTHSGTSNAGPVAVGAFAKVLHEARALLGDTTNGNAGGVVASGTPIACGDAEPDCALGDGVLTRAEWWNLVFHNVLPAPQQVSASNQVPTTEHAYYYQGHGHLRGRMRGDDAWNAEWGRMIANARGAVSAYERPAGERTWFTVDSKCRQRFWGAWSGGYYTGAEEPDPDATADPLASAYDAWCSPLPNGLFRS